MPKTKVQEVVFALLMSLGMVFAMELYNTALRMGGLSAACLPSVLGELPVMLPLCFVTSFFLMDPLAQRLAFAQVTPGTDSPILVTLVRSGITVALMCPAMSLWAALIFHGVSGETCFVWIQTLVRNFPMALCWQIFFCGPLVRKVFRTVFRRQLQPERAESGG